jgi:hypothetical protein
MRAAGSGEERGSHREPLSIPGTAVFLVTVRSKVFLHTTLFLTYVFTRFWREHRRDPLVLAFGLLARVHHHRVGFTNK